MQIFPIALFVVAHLRFAYFYKFRDTNHDLNESIESMSHR